MCKTNIWIKGIILGPQLLSFKKLGLIDKLLLEHVGLTHILDQVQFRTELGCED